MITRARILSLTRFPPECDVSEANSQLFHSYYGILLTTLIEISNWKISKSVGSLTSSSMNFKPVNKAYKLKDNCLIESRNGAMSSSWILSSLHSLTKLSIIILKTTHFTRRPFEIWTETKNYSFSSILCIYCPITNQATLITLLADLWMEGNKSPERTFYELNEQGLNVEKHTYFEIRNQNLMLRSIDFCDKRIWYELGWPTCCSSVQYIDRVNNYVCSASIF